MLAQPRSDAKSVNEKLASQRKWLFQTICALKAEISDLEYEIKGRELLLRKQNADIQDAFSRYITSTKEHCESEMDVAAKKVEDFIISKRIQTVAAKSARVREISASLTDEVTHLVGSAEILEDRLERMRHIVEKLGHVNQAKMQAIADNRNKAVEWECDNVVSRRMHAVECGMRQKFREANERMTRKNHELEQLSEALSDMIEAVSKRIIQESEAVVTLEKQVAQCMAQTPRLALEMVHYEQYTVAPLSHSDMSQKHKLFDSTPAPFRAFSIFRKPY